MNGLKCSPCGVTFYIGLAKNELEYFNKAQKECIYFKLHWRSGPPNSLVVRSCLNVVLCLGGSQKCIDCENKSLIGDKGKQQLFSKHTSYSKLVTTTQTKKADLKSSVAVISVVPLSFTFCFFKPVAVVGFAFVIKKKK